MIEPEIPYSLLSSFNFSGPSELLYCALSKTKILMQLAEQTCYPEGLKDIQVFLSLICNPSKTWSSAFDICL